MSEEVFDALLKIIDAKIAAVQRAGDWDGGINEAIEVDWRIAEFKEKFVVREDD